jgi:hypothetical protein
MQGVIDFQPDCADRFGDLCGAGIGAESSTQRGRRLVRPPFGRVHGDRLAGLGSNPAGQLRFEPNDTQQAEVFPVRAIAFDEARRGLC